MSGDEFGSANPNSPGILTSSSPMPAESSSGGPNKGGGLSALLKFGFGVYVLYLLAVYKWNGD
jgi:hypothetical protein